MTNVNGVNAKIRPVLLLGGPLPRLILLWWSFLSLTLTPPRTLAIRDASAFLVVSNGVVADRANNMLVAIAFPSALAVTACGFTTDATRPSLLSFDLDMAALKLSLTFNEQMLLSSLTAASLTIQSTQGSSAQSVTLTTSAISGSVTPGRIVYIGLSAADANRIKLNTDLAVSKPTTWDSFTAVFIHDTVGLLINPVLSTNAVQVNVFEEDNVPPTLSSFVFDRNVIPPQLILTFSKAVDVTSLMVSKIVLQDNLVPGSSVPLTTGMLMSGSVNGDIWTVSVSLSDFAAISLSGTICLLPIYCNLITTAIAFTDMLNNDGAIISSALTAITVTVDTQAPSLLTSTDGFVSFDWTTRTFVLAFNKPVDVSSFTASGLSFGSAYNSATPLALSTSTTPSSNGNTISIVLSSGDYNALLLNPSICSSAGTCWITISTAFIKDLSSNPVSAINFVIRGFDLSRIPTSFVKDTIAPNLVGFDLNLDIGRITLSLTNLFLVNPCRRHSLHYNLLKMSLALLLLSATDLLAPQVWLRRRTDQT